MRGGFGVKAGWHKQRPSEAPSGAPSGLNNSLNNSFTNWLLVPYGKGRPLDAGGTAGPRVMNLAGRVKRGTSQGRTSRGRKGSRLHDSRNSRTDAVAHSCSSGHRVYDLGALELVARRASHRGRAREECGTDLLFRRTFFRRAGLPVSNFGVGAGKAKRFSAYQRKSAEVHSLAAARANDAIAGATGQVGGIDVDAH